MKGKKVLLGVTGSIAAYKVALLTRLLVKQDAQVRIVMTEASKSFISPLTLSTLSKNPVLSSFVSNDQGEWSNHVELGLWADLMIIAPCSANTISKMVSGQCDNLLLATYLSARCPVFFAPAMDLDMYQHPSTQYNLSKLQTFGNTKIHSGNGELASGLYGIGRMAEPEEIVHQVQVFFEKDKKLKGKKILITSGPTHEAIDPVRFIGNHSTGKMGKALAIQASNMGAEVEFVSGPVQDYPLGPNINIHYVTSAEQMLQKSSQIHKDSDIVIFAAAVADFKIHNISDQKIKKSDESMTLTLVKNKDIASTLGKQKKAQQIHIGFALETENEKLNAQEKLIKKNFDFIVLNSLNDVGAGFGHDTNKVFVIHSSGQTQDLALMTKSDLAIKILDLVDQKLRKSQQ